MKQSKKSNLPPELIFFRKRLLFSRWLPQVLWIMLVVTLLLTVCFCGGFNGFFIILFVILAGIFLLLIALLPWVAGMLLFIVTAQILASAGEKKLLLSPADVAGFRRLTLISFICDGAALVIFIWMLIYITSNGLNLI